MGIDSETFEDVFAPQRPPKMEVRRPKSNRNRPEARHSENRQERAERVVTEFKDSMLKKVQPQDRAIQESLYLDWIKKCLAEIQRNGFPYDAFDDADLKIEEGDRQAKITHLPTLIWLISNSESTGHRNVLEAEDVLYDFLTNHLTEWNKTSPNFREKFGIPTHFNDLDH